MYILNTVVSYKLIVKHCIVLTVVVGDMTSDRIEWRRRIAIDG